MPLDLVPRLSLCSSDIVAPGVALRRSLLHSSFDFFHWVKFHPKESNAISFRRGRHTPAHIQAKKKAPAPTANNSSPTVCPSSASEQWPFVWGLTSDRRSRKKVTKTQKKIYLRPDLQSRWTLQVRWPLGLEIPLDSNHDPSLQRRKAKRWPISPVLTPGARCGECRFKLPSKNCKNDSTRIFLKWLGELAWSKRKTALWLRWRQPGEKKKEDISRKPLGKFTSLLNCYTGRLEKMFLKTKMLSKIKTPCRKLLNRTVLSQGKKWRTKVFADCEENEKQRLVARSRSRHAEDYWFRVYSLIINATYRTRMKRIRIGYFRIRFISALRELPWKLNELNTRRLHGQMHLKCTHMCHVSLRWRWRPCVLTHHCYNIRQGLIWSLWLHHGVCVPGSVWTDSRWSCVRTHSIGGPSSRIGTAERAPCARTRSAPPEYDSCAQHEKKSDCGRADNDVAGHRTGSHKETYGSRSTSKLSNRTSLDSPSKSLLRWLVRPLIKLRPPGTEMRSASLVAIT